MRENKHVRCPGTRVGNAIDRPRNLRPKHPHAQATFFTSPGMDSIFPRYASAKYATYWENVEMRGVPLLAHGRNLAMTKLKL
jgi:hypothetical protein